MVKDEGNTDAPLVLIGDAPGRQDALHGRPFVGPAGHRLEVWWRRLGLKRTDFYLTYVLGYMPKNIDRVPREEMEAAIEALLARLRALSNPAILIPTGNYGLYALTGKGKVSWHHRDGKIERPGIDDWRGSILTVELKAGQFVTAIPTLHPSRVLGAPGLERRTVADWERIREGAKDRTTLSLPERDHMIRPTIEDLEAYVTEALTFGKYLSIDIETPRGNSVEFLTADGWKSKLRKADEATVIRYKSGKKKGQPKQRKVRGAAYIGCIGFAYEENRSLTVPLTIEYWKTQEKLKRAKELVSRLLDSKLEKVMQNGMFDSSWLLHEGYPLRNWKWDTRAMHHALDPRDDHDLAYMASMLTRQPFWKHEAKDPDEITKYASNSDALWTYNGIDVTVTLEIFFKLRRKLIERGLLPFYLNHYAAMMMPLLDMTMYGIRADRERMKTERATLLAKQVDLAKVLEDVAGIPLVAKTGLSNDRLKFFLYGAGGFKGEKQTKTYNKLLEKYPTVVPLRLPVQRAKAKRGEDPSATVNEVALRKLMLRFGHKLGTLGPALLDFRRNAKMAEFLDDTKCDYDSRMRCQFSFITEAGRLSSQENAWGTGRNLQNIDRELRYVFVPD